MSTGVRGGAPATSATFSSRVGKAFGGCTLQVRVNTERWNGAAPHPHPHLVRS